MIRFCRFFLFLIVMASCSIDVEINAPYREIPVVYCVLDPGDSVHYLRLEKSFNGPADAYDMAQNPDSIYYKDAAVTLERWENAEAREFWTFGKIEYIPRNEGVFVSDPNYLYSLSAKLKANNEYRLKIRIEGQDTEVTAITHLVDDFRVIKPEYFRTSLPFSSYDNYLDIEWITAKYTRVFQVMIRFHYLEIKGQDTSRLFEDWNLANFSAEHDGGGILMDTKVLHRSFYQWLGNRLTSVPKNITRLADKKTIDVWFTVGGDELYTYLQIYQPDDNLPRESMVFTNISNGVGIFSSRFEKGLLGKSFSYHSIDSIAHGMYTSHLGFDDSTNDYYNFGGE